MGQCLNCSIHSQSLMVQILQQLKQKPCLVSELAEILAASEEDILFNVHNVDMDTAQWIFVYEGALIITEIGKEALLALTDDKG